jgi:hypothetical protein
VFKHLISAPPMKAKRHVKKKGDGDNFTKAISGE